MAKTPDWVLRRGSAQDVSAMAAVINAAYRPFVEAGLDLPDVSAGLSEDIAAAHVWVAEDASGLLGVLVVSTRPPTAHLMNVAVAPIARGRGIGGALIRHAIDLARSSACRNIVLATHTGMPENVALYEKFGWQIKGQDGLRIRMSRPCV
ncbi:GNAT family N-acetyltransferase [Shimia thalassica]|uniref:GNAT family N-acetyltransferase n=1 Tax=Shimia thalassica TaxID=1715693 RepID=UPI002732D555|nr:GNAT family N-acetyltransferase [Shimia thalassica]MDP2517429.1 GNAT family N-acetyltransferase [Shimia thalassica]